MCFEPDLKEVRNQRVEMEKKEGIPGLGSGVRKGTVRKRRILVYLLGKSLLPN